MGFWSKLFGASGDRWKPRAFFENTTREQVLDWFAHVSPWCDLDTRLQDLYILRMMGNPMFELFVHVSMEQNLVAKYRQLENLIPVGVPAAIYARTADILCSSGRQSRDEFMRLLPNARAGRTEQMSAHYMAAISAFDAAVHIEPDFAPAYAEMATTLMIFQKRKEAADWCRRAIAVVAKFGQAPLPHRPGMDLASSASGLDRHLRDMLNEIERG
jgi:hypothetical protein